MSDSTRDIREERRWSLLDEGAFGHDEPQAYITAAATKLTGNEELIGIFYPDRGESILQPGQVAVRPEVIENAFPSNWLDPLLIGPDARKFPDCRDVEWLINKIKDRVMQELTSPAADQPNNKDPECHT